MTHKSTRTLEKALLLTTCLSLGLLSLKAQSITIFKSDDSSQTMAKSTTLDNAYLRCQYKYSWINDTTTADVTPTTDDMVLEIGKECARFYSYRTYVSDSLISTATIDEIVANPGKFKAGSYLSFYKNYPTGKMTVTDKIYTDFLLYEEAIPEFAWTICDSTSTFLSYPIQMATCTFRGRDYVAWFTPEISVTEGPWKFNGLPGLILKVRDTRNQYCYEMTGITQSANSPILFKEYKYMKTDRKKYTQILRRYKEDPIGYINKSSNAKIIVKNADGTDNTDLAKPKALTYDFIERDLN